MGFGPGLSACIPASPTEVSWRYTLQEKAAKVDIRGLIRLACVFLLLLILHLLRLLLLPHFDNPKLTFMRSIHIPNPAVKEGIMLQHPPARIGFVALLQRFA